MSLLPRVVTPEEALERILSRISPLEVERRSLLDALDHVLAEDISAPLALPPYDSSAMDGFALHEDDLHCLSELQVEGESQAGHPPGPAVRPGTVVLISTGAALPRGAAAVIPHEATETCGVAAPGSPPARIRIRQPVQKGANIRSAGEDVRPGQRLFGRGRIVGPAELAVLAAVGRPNVGVVKRPVVSVLATGDELVEPGAPLAQGKVFNSNGYALAAQALRAGGLVRQGEIVGDTEAELRSRLHGALDADLVVTAGGVSSGPHDHVARVLAGEGLVETLAVRMKPGKPLAIGWLRRGGRATGRTVPYIGLPGNPIAAMVGFELFARPAILRLRGISTLERPRVEAIAAEDFANTGDRTAFFRVRLVEDCAGYRAVSAGLQRSHALSSLLDANGLAVVPPGGVRSGESVTVRLVDWSCAVPDRTAGRGAAP